MKHGLAWMGMALLIGGLVWGCTGPEGPMGPAGPAGTAGVSLIGTHQGTIPSDGSWTVDVPEIYGRQNSTFVEAYWAFAETPDIWTLMADGWLDDNTSLAHICAVSWTYGKVYLTYMTGGDRYLLKVYQTQ